MQQRLAEDAGLSRLVEPFDPDRYNTNATLAENLLFGSPVGPVFDPERSRSRPTSARRWRQPVCSATCSRPASAGAERCSSCSPTCRRTTSTSGSSASSAPEDLRPTATWSRGSTPPGSTAFRRRTSGCSCRRPSSWSRRHRLGLMTPELMDKVLEARRYFRDHLPERHAGRHRVLRPDPLQRGDHDPGERDLRQDRLRPSPGAARIAELITDLLDQLELRAGVMAVGLDRPPGSGRSSRWRSGRSSGSRAFVKRPDLLVLYDPLVRST